MKAIRKLTATLSTLTLTTVLALTFNACSEQSPLQPAANDVASDTLAKRSAGGSGGTDGGDGGRQSEDYPQYAEGTFTYNESQGSYQGGTVNVPGGTKLSLASGALTSPSGTPTGDPVTITMLVEKKKHKGKEVLEFTFGPHGSSFDPPVEVVFDWTDLGIDVASLFYIDNGTYVPQSADDIDIQNRKIKLYLHHFSRYAIGAGE